jgi:hypothetical protein
LGDLDRKIESMRLAQTLDPRNPRWTHQLILDLIFAHRYDEASAEIDSADIQDYALSYWRSVLDLREHRDFGRWSETVAVIQKELAEGHDLYDLWEARIAARDFEGAEELARVMQERPNIGLEKHGSLQDKARTQIITYWFLQEDNHLSELLSEARTVLGAGAPPDLLYDPALLSAAEGNTEETEQMVRTWRRERGKYIAEKIYQLHEMCRLLGMAGASTAAVDCIREGLSEPSLVMPFKEAYLPYYDSIRGEPEFVALLAELSG